MEARTAAAARAAGRSQRGSGGAPRGESGQGQGTSPRIAVSGAGGPEGKWRGAPDPAPCSVWRAACKERTWQFGAMEAPTPPPLPLGAQRGRCSWAPGARDVPWEEVPAGRCGAPIFQLKELRLRGDRTCPRSQDQDWAELGFQRWQDGLQKPHACHCARRPPRAGTELGAPSSPGPPSAPSRWGRG